MCIRDRSYAVSINKPEVCRKIAYQYITHYATMEQIVNAFVVLSGVINGKELFDCVKQDRVYSKNGLAQTVGANSIFGALGVLIDGLHLSYKEAFEMIPYPCLLMMNSDKSVSYTHLDVYKRQEMKSLFTAISISCPI